VTASSEAAALAACRLVAEAAEERTRRELSAKTVPFVPAAAAKAAAVATKTTATATATTKAATAANATPNAAAPPLQRAAAAERDKARTSPHPQKQKNGVVESAEESERQARVSQFWASSEDKGTSRERTMFPGQEGLLDVMRHIGVSDATQRLMLNEEYDLESLMVSTLADLLEIGIERKDAARLTEWVQG